MFQFFSNIVKNIEVDVFFKKSSKNRIVKNWKTSHREKHRIVKKSEHRPPLGGIGGIGLGTDSTDIFVALEQELCPPSTI